MIIDTSAIIAILIKEPGHERLITKLNEATTIAVGAPTLTEAGIVLTARLGGAGLSVLGRLIQELDVIILPFGALHWQAAVDAYDRYGKGRHPAALNFGDCMTYATAKLSEQALLAIGQDFEHTDLDLA